MDLLIFAIIILALLGFLFYRYRKRNNFNKNPYLPELLNKCSGDKKKAQRLIHFELERHPRITRKEATKYALDSLLRDK